MYYKDYIFYDCLPKLLFQISLVCNFSVELGKLRNLKESKSLLNQLFIFIYFFQMLTCIRSLKYTYKIDDKKNDKLKSLRIKNKIISKSFFQRISLSIQIKKCVCKIKEDAWISINNSALTSFVKLFNLTINL